MADWSTYLAGLLGNQGILTTGDLPGILGQIGPQGILGPAVPPATPQASQSLLGPLNTGQPNPQGNGRDVTALQGENGAPAAGNGGDFWSRTNPDGTQDILGGLLKYDPAKDLGRNNRLGMIGATFADMGANIGGHPEAARNLQVFGDNQKKLTAQQALADVFNNLGQPPAPPAAVQALPRLADSAASQLPTAAVPAPAQPNNTGSPAPAVAPQGLPQAQTQPQPFDIRSLAPKLAKMAAAGIDIGPVLSILKDAQPDFNTEVQYTHDNRPYVLDHSGNVKFLDSAGVTRPTKLQIGPNGLAYDENNTPPGTDFSKKDSPFDSATGAPNKPVQQYETDQKRIGASLAAQNSPNSLLLPILHKMQNGQPLSVGDQSVIQALKPTMVGLNQSGQAAGLTGQSQIDATAPGYSQKIVANSGGLTQSAIDQGAILFASTGRMPSGMGMGSTGAAGERKTAIQNRAGELDTGGNMAANGAQLKALTSSLTQQTKYADSVERSVNNAENGFNQVVSAFKGKVNNSSLPIVNALTNAGKYQFSPGEVSALRGGLNEVSNEYANVFSRGGQTTDAVRAQAKSIADGNLSIGDLGKVFTELQAQGHIVANGSRGQAQKIQAQLNGILQGTQSESTSAAARSSLPLSPGGLPRLKSAPAAGISGGVKWRILPEGGR